MNFRSFIALSLGLLAAAGCDLEPPNRSGGGTEGVGLSGMLLLPDGSPAVGARVYAYALNDYRIGLAKAGGTSAGDPVARDSAVSDVHGAFALDRLDPGTYNLEGLRAGDTALGWFTSGVVYDGGKKDLGPISQPP